MQSQSNSGFMPLLVAIGIVSVLGMMSLTTSMSSGLLNRKTISRLNAIESFYAAEMAIWHGHFRLKENLTPSEATAVTLDNDPYSDESRLPASETYDPAPGISHSITVTKTVAPQKVLVRRFLGTNLIYDYDPSKKAVCARLHFKNAKRQFRSCLVESGEAPQPTILVGWGALGNPTYFVVTRWLGEKLDPDYGTNGMTIVKLRITNAVLVQGMVKMPDGSTLIVNGAEKKRLFPNGLEDTSFDSSQDATRAMVYDSNSYINYHQSFGEDGADLSSQRLFFAGGKDGAFNSPNYFFSHGYGPVLLDSWVLSNGQIREFVYSHNSDPATLGVFQRDRSGNLDPAFGDAHSSVQLQVSGLKNSVTSHAVEDGVLALAQDNLGYLRLKKYRLNGTIDTSYGSGGELVWKPEFMTQRLDQFKNDFYSFYLDQKKTLPIEVNIEIGRILINGTLDKSFGTDGTLNLNFIISLKMAESLRGCPIQCAHSMSL